MLHLKLIEEKKDINIFSLCPWFLLIIIYSLNWPWFYFQTCVDVYFFKIYFSVTIDIQYYISFQRTT